MLRSAIIVLPTLALLACGQSSKPVSTAESVEEITVGSGVCPELYPDDTQPTDDYHEFTLCGWPVFMKSDLYQDAKARPVFAALKSDLGKLHTSLPTAALTSLQQTNIWLELEEPNFPGGVYHPSSQWLQDNGYPVKWARGVQLGNAQNYLTWTQEQPAMVLHEMAHAYDDQMYGFANPELLAAYENARQSGIYEAVEYVNTNAGLLEAYALTDSKEYFAELTEALFWQNDFYPFDRQQLQMFDLQGFNAVEAMWQQR